MTVPDISPAARDPKAPSDSSPPPGFDEVAVFSSVEEEYAALRGGTGVVDRSARMLFGGAQATDTLTGLVTNDVGALHAGAGQYAAALTAKGKVISDVRIFARGDDLLLDTPAGAGPGFAAMIRKYVNPRLARSADVSAVLRTIGVFGPRSHGVLASVLGAEGAPAPAVAALRGLANYHHIGFDFSGARVVIARVPDFGGDGFDCFVPVEAAALLWQRLEKVHALPVGRDATEVARVEAGRPLWGIDMDDSTLAVFNANPSSAKPFTLLKAVDTKGAGAADLVDYDPKQRKIYVTNPDDGFLSSISIDTDKVPSCTRTRNPSAR